MARGVNDCRDAGHGSVRDNPRTSMQNKREAEYVRTRKYQMVIGACTEGQREFVTSTT
jgi:hypothetical protein